MERDAVLHPADAAGATSRESLIELGAVRCRQITMQADSDDDGFIDT